MSPRARNRTRNRNKVQKTEYEYRSAEYERELRNHFRVCRAAEVISRKVISFATGNPLITDYLNGSLPRGVPSPPPKIKLIVVSLSRRLESGDRLLMPHARITSQISYVRPSTKGVFGELRN